MAIDANALIGTTAPAPRQADMALESWQSHDYYNNNPYPQHAFGNLQWPADKGPRPTPLPYAQVLINEGAEFVFRNGEPTFSVPDDPEADAFLQQVIAQNDLTSEWVPLAIAAAHQGAVAAKFSFDGDDPECPVRISFLDIPQECRVWTDPHDRKRVLMARIQYPYRDLETGEWCHYREEWTADRYVVYLPKRTGDTNTQDPRFLPGYQDRLGDGEGWQIDPAHDDTNPFGLVPVTVLRNRKVKGNPLGEGDLWRLWRLIDRVAVTMHGEDKANQLHSEPATAYLNARPDNEGPLLPGEPVVLVNGEDNGPPADVKLLEPTGAAREYSHRSMDRWEDLLYKAAGLSRVNPAEVTNKGNMTALAFAMTFGRTISTSDRKRKLLGDSGLCVFFRNLLIGLSRVGGIKALAGLKESAKVACVWPKYFEATDADVQTITDRTLQQKDGGVLDLERAARRIATAEKMPPAEIEQLVADLRARAAAEAAADDEDEAGGEDPGAAGDDAAELADVMDSTGVNNFTA